MKNKKTIIYAMSFLIPFLIVMFYFIFRGIYPFGNKTNLVADAWSQYIIFFDYANKIFKQGNLDGLLYNFSKSLGGEMTSVWAYYLMSPLNILLIFFNHKNMTIAFWLITCLKYGLSGLSMSFLLNHTKRTHNNYLNIAFSVAYALNGWILANQINIMWLDAMIFLPLIIYGINNIFEGKPFYTYSIFIGLMLIINYYMSYMIIIFTILYVFILLNTYKDEFHVKMDHFIQYIYGNILGIGLSSVLILPTFFAVTQSKGAYSKVINSSKTLMKPSYNPLLQLTKFMTGSFNMTQFPMSAANVFVGSFVLIMFLLYFINNRIALRERVSVLLVSIFMVCSFWFKPLILMWHGLQFPIWYMDRFSFLFVFLMIYVAYRNYNLDSFLTIKQLLYLLIIFVPTYVCLYVKYSHLIYLNSNQITITLIFTILSVLALLLNKDNRNFTVFLLIVIEMIINASITLNGISFMKQNIYTDYLKTTQPVISNIKSKNKNKFYRIEKTFMSTKNDAMLLGYNGGTHFDSAFESQIPSFMRKVGFPADTGSTTYSNGTAVMDSLLSMQYFLDKNRLEEVPENKRINSIDMPYTDKPDLKKQYNKIASNKYIDTYKNKYALPIAYMGSDKVLDFNMYSNYPLKLQQNMFNSLVGNHNNNKIFESQKFANIELNNLFPVYINNKKLYEQKDTRIPSSVTYTVEAKTNDSYYLTLPGHMSDYADVTINGLTLNQYAIYSNTVAVNLGANNKGQTYKIVFQLKNNRTMPYSQIQLYRLNQRNYVKGIKVLSENTFKEDVVKQEYIKGKINVTNSNRHLLMTSIPYSRGWNVYVDHKPAQQKKVFNTFIGINLKNGKHTVEFKYSQPYLKEGAIITSISIVMLIVLIFSYKKEGNVDNE